MKKSLSLVLLTFLVCILTACSTSVKELATDYLKSQMKDPSSFKVESVEIIKDTVPYYLLDNIQFNLTALNNDMDKYSDYLKLGDAFMSDRVSLSKTISMLEENIKGLCEQSKREVANVACVKYSAKNGMGNMVSNEAIVILSDDKEPKVVGFYKLDSEFIKNVLLFLDKFNGGLKKNQYGKYDTSNMSPIEKFILSENS